MESFEQLRQTYADMTEDELAAVAADAYDLTEMAQQVLRAEISGRGLKIELKSTPPPPPVEDASRLTVITTVWNQDEARKMQNLLSAGGILSFFGHDNVEGIDSFHGSFERGVDLKVDCGDARMAGQLIESTQGNSTSESSEGENDEDDGDIGQEQFAVRCPKCHSVEIVLDGREAEAGVEREEDEKYKWHCDACGHQWIDDGVEEQV